MKGFEEQGLSAAQWSLLTHPTHEFWKDKSPPRDASLWAWAIDNTPEEAETLDMMAPPFGEKRYPMASGSQINPQGLNVSFTWVDDGGHFHTGTAPVLHP